MHGSRHVFSHSTLNIIQSWRFLFFSKLFNAYSYPFKDQMKKEDQFHLMQKLMKIL